MVHVMLHAPVPYFVVCPSNPPVLLANFQRSLIRGRRRVQGVHMPPPVMNPSSLCLLLKLLTSLVIYAIP